MSHRNSENVFHSHSHFSNAFLSATIWALSLILSTVFSSPAFAGGIPNPQNSSHQQTVHFANGQGTVVFVHGYSFASLGQGYDCNAYWQDAIDYLKKDHGASTWHNEDFRLIKYYNGDTNCTNGSQDVTRNKADAPSSHYHSANLHHQEYANKCDGYRLPLNRPESDGTQDESLYHLGCLFAWYLYYNFAVEPGQNVVIAAHSMGGIIVRVALTFTSLAFPQFPPTVGNISDVVTFGTPHGGATGLGNFSFLQARELATGSEFMKNMKERSKNPQAIGDLHIKTEWTVIGSAGDGVAMGVNSLDIDGVSHKVMYLGQTNIIKRNNVSETRQWRYDHGGYLHYKQGDLLINTDEWTYNQEVCDAPTPGSNACDLGNYDPHDPPSPPSWFQSKTLASPLHTMLLAFAPVVKNGEGVCTPTKRIC